jgi:predicted AlkP superfamily phosphohydrolase/phosphomutase
MTPASVSRTLTAVTAALLGTVSAVDAQAEKDRVPILVVDGLRPDYVTPALMPQLNALAERGVRGLRHHAVFPTVTRVNSPSIFSGRYPGGTACWETASTWPKSIPTAC